MKSAIFISKFSNRVFSFKKINSLGREFVFGLVAGVGLALSFKPYEFRILALISTLILVWRTKKNILNNESIKYLVVLFFSFLFFNRIVYFKNDYYLLINKIHLNHYAYPAFFTLMTLQVISLSLLLIVLFHFFCKRFFQNKNSLILFFYLIMTFLLLEIGSYWTVISSPILSIGNTLKWIKLFSFWGHLFVSFFYYSLIASLFSFKKYRVHVIVFIMLIFSTPLFFHSKNSKINHLRFITVNQRFNIIHGDNTFAPSPLQYLNQLSETHKNINNKNTFFIWNEAAFIQLPKNKKIITDIKELILNKLPAIHFLGSIELNQLDNGLMYGQTKYESIGYSNLNLSHSKNYLVPIEENINYFPWIPYKFFLKPLAIEKGDSMGILNVNDIKFGILLCNEMAEIFRLSFGNFYSNVDIILNPSNVAHLFENSYEEFLDEYAQWTNLSTGKPVLRSSSSGKVSLFHQGKIEKNFQESMNTKIVPLTFNQF